MSSAATSTASWCTRPGPGYYATTLGGLAVSLALILSTTPLLRRLTGPETARND